MKITYLGYPHIIIYGKNNREWDYPCTIQILTDEQTGETSLGWYRGLMPGFDFSEFDYLGEVFPGWRGKE